MLTKRQIKKGLVKKGFTLFRSNKHLHYRYFLDQSKGTHVQTHLSHGGDGKDVGEDLIAKMARQCRISANNFRGLIDCTVSEEQFRLLLREFLD